MKAAYTQILTIGERAAAMRMGMYAKFAEHGIRPSQIDEFVKDSSISISAGGTAKAIAAVSLLTGVPIGIAAHAIGRCMKTQNNREKQLTNQIDFYRNATGELESNLAASTPKM